MTVVEHVGAAMFKKLFMNGKGEYTGELNDKDEAHGEGELTCKTGTYAGTFRSKKLDGYCKK